MSCQGVFSFLDLIRFFLLCTLKKDKVVFVLFLLGRLDLPITLQKGLDITYIHVFSYSHCFHSRLSFCLSASVCQSVCLPVSSSLYLSHTFLSLYLPGPPLIFVHLPTCLPFPSCLSLCSLFTLSPIISLSLSLSLSLTLTGLQATKISQPSHTSNARLQKDQRSYLTEFSPCLRSP